MKFTGYYNEDYNPTLITSTDGVWFWNGLVWNNGANWAIFCDPISVLEMALRGVDTP